MTASIAVVIPCYRVRRHILGVLAGLRGRVTAIYVVDDACPEGTGRFVQATAADPTIRVLFHAENQGVGGAVLTGYAAALADGHAIVVKMDGDGQMDPAYLDALLAPVLSGAAAYAKGDRFCGLASLRAMPPGRVVGNFCASLAMWLASGWRGMDPCNGYTAISRDMLARIPLAGLERRWFFECDMLCWLSGAGATVANIAIPARYNGEASGLNTMRVLREFPRRLAVRALRRAW